MTKKHFEAIAAILLDNGADQFICSDMADLFAAENPRFDRDRFLKACGL